MMKTQSHSLLCTVTALLMPLMLQTASADVFYADFEDDSGVNNPSLWMPDNAGQAWGIATFPGSGQGLKNLNEGCGTTGNTPLPGVTDFTDGIIQLDMSWDDDDSWGVIFRQTAADNGYLVFFGYVETGSVIIVDLATGCGAMGQCLSDSGCENDGQELTTAPHGLTGLTQDLSVSYTGRIEVKGDMIRVWYLPTADIADPLGDLGPPLIEFQDATHSGPGSVGIWQESQGGCMIDNVMVITGDPAQAAGPKPADGAEDVIRDVVLGWTAGEFANTHNVSMGTSFTDVNEASAADPRGVSLGEGLTDTTLDPGRLDFGQTYFWRVDEANGAPDFTVFEGNVWRFTVEPLAYPVTPVTVTASSAQGESVAENTINGSGLTDDLHSTLPADMWLSLTIPATIEYAFDRAYKLHELWIWNSNQVIESFIGFGAKDVVIEHSLDGVTWTVLEGVGPLAQAPGVPGYAHNNTIDFGGTVAQHVRVTVNTVQGFAPAVSLSEVRFYHTPTFATQPDPPSGATGVAPDASLFWGRNGREADHHDVYVGTDANDLPRVGTIDAMTIRTEALNLDLGQAYAWRVDEVNDTMNPSTWTGTVWSFTTADTISLDDMERYKDEALLEPWATWFDGFDDPSNGSLVGNGATGSPETDIVHGGSQSLPVYYVNVAAAHSEATRTFGASMNWTRHGVVALVLYFHGSSANTGGQLYVKINDTRVAYDGEASGLMRGGWRKWYIPLAEVAANVSGVTSLVIGIDGGGAGVVYVDDIFLTADVRDLITPVAPRPEGLVARYDFEGTTNDSAGANHGTEVGGPLFAAGQTGQALEFDGQDDVVETGKSASSLGMGGNDPRTVAAWVLTRSFNNGGIFDVGGRSNGQDFSLRTLTTDNLWRIQYWGGGFDVDFSYPTLDQWVHFALIHDGTHTKLYADGLLIIDVPRTLDTADTNPFQIGAYGWPDAFFNGLIDDVQVYSRALSDAEVAGMVGLTQAFDRP